LFSIGLSAQFDAQRLVDQTLEGGRIAHGGPQLQFGVACGSELQKRVLSAIVEFEARNHLRMAPVEVLRETKNRGQGPNDLAALA
jgi:hypothetical protein